MVSHYGDPRDHGIGTLLTMDLTEMYLVCVLLQSIYFCAQGGTHMYGYDCEAYRDIFLDHLCSCMARWALIWVFMHPFLPVLALDKTKKDWTIVHISTS